jgi:hypothetical protein
MKSRSPPLLLPGYAQPTIEPFSSSASQQSSAMSVFGPVSDSRTSSRVKSGSPTDAMSLACASLRISGTSSRVGRRVAHPAGSALIRASDHTTSRPGS